MPIQGERVTPEEYTHEKAMAQAIVTALGEFIQGRINDLPHRFKAPPAFAHYMADIENMSRGTSNVSQVQIGWGALPIIMQWMTRPRQHILEMVFQSADGLRLFTLEIEYGDAIQQTREVLLSWRKAIHKKTNHRNTPRKGSAQKASSFLNVSPGRLWRKILPRLGAELTLTILNRNQ